MIATTGKTRGRGNSLLADVRKNAASYLLALPALLYTFVFGYLTLPYILMAFQRFDYRKGLLGSDFVGFRNFEFFFRSNRAIQVTFNTIWLNLLFIVIGTLLALVIALMLNEIHAKRYLKVIQSGLLFPNFLSWVIVSYIVFAFLSSEKGIVNGALSMAGLKRIEWYGNGEPWRAILVVIRVWKTAGISSVMYLAAITAIDGALYEAATIDGAGRIRQMRHITLPLLMPTVCILALLAVGKIFYGDFQMFYTIIGDNGLLIPKTDVIDTYVYRALRATGDPSSAMAVGLYQAFVGFLLVYGSNRLVRRWFPEGAVF